MLHLHLGPNHNLIYSSNLLGNVCFILRGSSFLDLILDLIISTGGRFASSWRNLGDSPLSIAGVNTQKQPITGLLSKRCPEKSPARNFMKEEHVEQAFSCQFCIIFQTSFFAEHLQTNAFESREHRCSLGNFTKLSSQALDDCYWLQWKRHQWRSLDL